MTQNNFNKTGLQGYAVSTNWSLGHIPLSTEDALINSGVIVVSSVSETVNSIAVGSANGGSVLSIGSGIFTAKNGTGSNTNTGVIAITGATFEVDSGTIDNPGTIELKGSAALVLPSASVTLDGGGSIKATIGGGPTSNTIQSGNINNSPSLINQNNTISGDLTIGDGLIFTNDGMVETNNNTSVNAGTVAILGTAGVYISNSGNFINNGTVQADPNGKLIFGVDNVTGSVDNESNINLVYNGSGTSTELEIAGDMTITGISHTGVINMEGSDPLLGDAILSDGKAATLTLVNQTIEGGGVIGDFDLTVDNVSGTIDATGTGGSLYLGFEGQGPTMTNGGTFEATAGAFLNIQANVANTGTIAALGGGTVQLQSAITGSGAIDIGANSYIVAWSTVANNITFTGAGADLEINNSLANGGIGGEIVGAAIGDTIDLTSDVTFYAASDYLSWQQTNAGSGTLSLLNSSGTTLEALNLAGSFTTADFTVTSNGSGIDQSTLITVVNQTPAPPNPPPPAATTADMIMRDDSNGNYEIYDLGNNTILGAYPLGQVGPEWQVAGLGGFDGTDTSDMILRDSATGAFELYDISNNKITNAVAMGQVGPEWTVSGFADFSGKPGETDMLMQNGSTGQFELYDISNNQITGAVSMGQVGAPWVVSGFGDFSGKAGETGDMLMRNGSTGAFEVYDITNNQITFAAGMGQVGPEWSVAGFGDFSSNANETDMLMRNSSTGAFELYDISNNQITNALSMGQVGPEWQVAGFGPINGAGTSDMLMRNTSTGAFEIYDIANNQITSAAPMGQVGPGWSVAGIAADPPGTPPANAQLVQAMANYASPGGALDTTSPLGQPPTLPASPSLFAPASGQPQPA